ncbi:MAG: SsrA-binding protein SmpB [Kiritimatiellae bacterium]|nr:SsrA-binding protein SmpB [Kiritimatiellia bacterium]
MSKSSQTQSARRLKIVNRKARHDYFILERFEAGIELLGTEVKSIREGQADLTSGFAGIEKGQVFLRDLHVRPYEFGHQFNHDPRRPRRLLLHKNEIRKMTGELARKGMTLIPLSLYLNQRGLIKVELGLCRGKHAPDKRNRLRQETVERETARAVAAHARR